MKMKIETGRRYLTRDGRVALVDFIYAEPSTYPIQGVVDGGRQLWREDGQFLDARLGPLDLVSEVIEFDQMVAALAKPGADIIAQMTPGSAHLMHMAIGQSGEAGELLDAIKKHVIYGKPLDRENVIEELGDIEFYLQGLRAALGVTREQTLAANIAKLGKRYHTGAYSDRQAQERADK